MTQFHWSGRHGRPWLVWLSAIAALCVLLAAWLTNLVFHVLFPDSATKVVRTVHSPKGTMEARLSYWEKPGTSYHTYTLWVGKRPARVRPSAVLRVQGVRGESDVLFEWMDESTLSVFVAENVDIVESYKSLRTDDKLVKLALQKAVR